MISGDLQQFGIGDRPGHWSASEMQAISDAAQAINNFEVGPGLEFSRVGTSAILNLVDLPAADAVSGSGVFEFKVVRLPPKADFVICNRVIGGEAGTDEIQVALPSKLRAEKQQGGVDYTYPDDLFNTGERNGTDPVTLRQQREVISDPYGIGDEIWAWNVTVRVARTTPAPIDPDTGEIEIDPATELPLQPTSRTDTYDWLDANNDSRRWLALPIEGSISEILEPPG